MEKARPGLAQIASVFARYGNFTFGGGSATSSVLHRELLEKRRWLSGDDFTLCFALARLTPGTNILAFCTGVGWLLRRASGAAAALLAASIPCTFLVTIVTALLSHWQANPVAEATIHGAVAAAIAISISASWAIAKPHFQRSRLNTALIGATAFLLHAWLKIPAIEILFLAGAAGALLPRPRA